MTYARLRGPALGATPVETPAPEPGRPQPPIYPLQVGAHGGWLEVRSTPADGSCGVSGYPCKHPGLDVAGPAGTSVVAPESGAVVMAGTGSQAPFVGYGPWFIIIQGQDSGRFHFLGHLDPVTSSMAPIGAPVVAGDQVGITSSANHTHWEVRDKMVPDFAVGEDNFTNNEDPLGWLSGASMGIFGTALLVGGAALFLWLLFSE
jgi:murein DD-endopeptidase MepM/ murein hydrolase activator NlpD